MRTPTCLRHQFISSLIITATLVTTAFLLAAFTRSAPLAQSNPNTVVSPALYQDLRWRSVGPQRGGRVTAVAPARSACHQSSSCTTRQGPTPAVQVVRIDQVRPLADGFNQGARRRGQHRPTSGQRLPRPPQVQG